VEEVDVSVDVHEATAAPTPGTHEAAEQDAAVAAENEREPSCRQGALDRVGEQKGVLADRPAVAGCECPAATRTRRRVGPAPRADREPGAIRVPRPASPVGRATHRVRVRAREAEAPDWTAPR
jgi:hypothetical protein